MASLGKGITNKQAKYLAALCRELRVPYSGRGMTRDEASIAITEYRKRVEEKREAQMRKLQRKR
jgi:hypothetical protein